MSFNVTLSKTIVNCIRLALPHHVRTTVTMDASWLSLPQTVVKPTYRHEPCTNVNLSFDGSFDSSRPHDICKSELKVIPWILRTSHWSLYLTFMTYMQPSFNILTSAASAPYKEEFAGSDYLVDSVQWPIRGSTLLPKWAWRLETMGTGKVAVWFEWNTFVRQWLSSLQ